MKAWWNFIRSLVRALQLVFYFLLYISSILFLSWPSIHRTDDPSTKLFNVLISLSCANSTLKNRENCWKFSKTSSAALVYRVQKLNQFDYDDELEMWGKINFSRWFRFSLPSSWIPPQSGSSELFSSLNMLRVSFFMLLKVHILYVFIEIAE